MLSKFSCLAALWNWAQVKLFRVLLWWYFLCPGSESGIPNWMVYQTLNFSNIPLQIFMNILYSSWKMLMFKPTDIFLEMLRHVFYPLWLKQEPHNNTTIVQSSFLHIFLNIPCFGFVIFQKMCKRMDMCCDKLCMETHSWLWASPLRETTCTNLPHMYCHKIVIGKKNAPTFVSAKTLTLVLF